VIEPFQYEFFRNGMLAAVMVGGLCGLVGVYIVLRGMSYIGHGLSHSVFGGAAVSYVMSVNFYLGASLWGFLSALLIQLTTRRRTISSDAAIGIVTTASFALGIAVISRYKTFTRSFDAALFGSVLGVTPGDLAAIAAVTAVSVIAVFAGYKYLLFTAFDAEVARTYHVPAGWVDTMFALVLAGTVVVSMQVIGVTMLAAAIVVPPVIARQITDSFGRMLLISTGTGAACAAAGVYISYYADVSSGAAVVLVAAALFIATMSWTGIRRRLAASRAARTTRARTS
jgi:manganese/iron transport system permease protein/iron/zinc/copper transport system permease protein